MPVYLLTDEILFPSPRLASENGILAIGGDLSEERLLTAYRQGIFPWYSQEEPIVWWSPDPRLVVYPDEIRIARSLEKIIRKGIYDITFDTAFEQVIRSCADVRLKKDEGTWIVEDMIKAYCRLHDSGYAHSVEAWCEGELAGGLYGVSMGRCFFGESMFTRKSNASKVAFVKLVEYLKNRSFKIIDCQVESDHLFRLGARLIPRKLFLQQLEQFLEAPTIKGKWEFGLSYNGDL